jgi:acetyltransferase-like isoleucine patch superfamily enzyme
MSQPKLGRGVVVGKNVQFGENVVIWNYVVIGDNTRIDDATAMGSFCDIGKKVVIGKNCNIQTHVTISNGCRIGNNVFIAPNSSLLNDKYPKSDLLTPVTVKDDVIIGGGVTVLPGVAVGEKSVIAGGSVVTKDVPPKTVVMGVPAKTAMSLEEYEAKREAFTKARR